MINKKLWRFWSFIFIMVVACICLVACKKTEPFLKFNTENLGEILYVNDSISLTYKISPKF